MSKIRTKECQNVEYKRSWQDEYLKWVCGFANAQGAVMYSLPANFTVKTLFKRHGSRPRNKLIANVFYLAGFIEAWGRGYEKIHDAFKAENLEMPVFEEVRGGFMATVKRERFLTIQKRLDVVNDVTSNVTSDVTSNVGSDVVSNVGSFVGS